jgi:hypothetical protein
MAAAAVAVAAVISYGRHEERQAAAGSPYYGKAVREAINGLTKTGAVAEPAARPALPEGFSPDEYYWCENCQAYHKRQPGQAQAPAAASPQVAGVQAAGGVPPLPEGLSPADYYWCEKCKSYHARQSGQAAPAAWAGVPYPLPAPSAPHP